MRFEDQRIDRSGIALQPAWTPESMTRENKLALIVGFGLVLFVGILVSDHLSIARRQSAASLRPNSTAYAFQPARAETRWFSFGTSAPPEGTPGPGIPEPAEPLPVSTTGHSPHHVVARGDTLQRICQRHYGEASLATALASYNRLPDPDRLTPQTRLLLPPRRVLVAEHAVPAAPNPGTAVSVIASARPVTSQEDRMGEYIVQPGDTLSEIAQQLLGSSRDTQRLFEMNRHVLRHVDDLREGDALRYPVSR